MIILGSGVLLAAAAAACGGGGGPTAPSAAAPTRIIELSGNLAFGAVTGGQTSEPLTLTIRNSGNSTLTVSGMTVPGGAYAASWLSGTIAAGGSQIVSFRFTPTSVGDFSGVLTVNGDQTSGTNTIPISGTGLAPIGSYNWTASGSPQFCSGGLCLYFGGTATNQGTGCATDVSFRVEFFTQEFGPILPDILVPAVESPPIRTLVRPSQAIGFQTNAVFTFGRHITAWRISVKYTAVSCQ